MSRNKARGTAAETAVCGFINVWYANVSADPDATPVPAEGYRLMHRDAESPRFPAVLTAEAFAQHPDQPVVAHLYAPDGILVDPNAGKRNWEAEGYPFARVPSKGLLDEGDVSGPLTAIEVKNYSSPPVGALLTNAEWKAANAGRPFWWLTYKAAGRGGANVGKWHSLTTVDEMRGGFGILADLGDEEVRALCAERDTRAAAITASAPGYVQPALPWSAAVRFTDRMAGMGAVWDDLWNTIHDRDAGGDAGVLAARVLPLIVSPRRGGDGELLPVGRWYVYSRLSSMCRILETIGILPQDAAEYPAPVAAPA